MIDTRPINAEEDDGATTMRELRPFLMARVVFGGIAAALAVTGWVLDLRYLPGLFAVFALIGLGSAARAIRRVYLGKVVPVTPISMSRRALLVLGVVAAVAICAVPDRPGGWIGGRTVVSIPHACDVLSPQLLLPFGVRGPEPDTTPGRYTEESDCTWNRFDGGLVYVAYTLYDRHGLHSGPDEAKHAIDAGISNLSLSPLVTQAPDSTANAHHIPGPLFTGRGKPPDSVAYVTASTVGNVVVSVAILGPFDIDQFSAVVHAATAAVEIQG